MRTTTHQEAAALALAGVLLLASTGCFTDDIVEEYSEQKFQGAPPPVHEDIAFTNWPLEPSRAEYLLPKAESRAVLIDNAGAGTTGALRVKLEFLEEEYLQTVKWKEFPRGSLDGINNAPRKEIAAYHVQKLFLEPENYVVPTTAARCVLPKNYPIHDRPTVEGSACIFGALSVWLQHVEVPPRLYERARFEEDETYAYYMSNLNLFTYLFDHQDGRGGNFLVSREPERRQVFSIDNGVAMNSWPWYNWFTRNWNKIRVPALRRDSIERLRALERGDLDRLLVVQQFALDADGIYRDVTPGPPLDPSSGVTIAEGTIQLGLTSAEIDGIWKRIQTLLSDVDAGEIALL